MSLPARKLFLLGTVAALLTACSDASPVAAPAQPEYSPAVAARLAAEQARIDSVTTLSRRTDGQVVMSNGLLGGLLGGVTNLLTGVVNGLTYTLLKCDVLPYAGSTRVIGPLGGTVGVGRSVLVIPPGALSAPTVITAEQPSTGNAEVRFSPHGLQFQRPASLTISYANCAQSSGFMRGIVYVNEEGKIVEAPPSFDIPGTNRVTGVIDHFSGYLVAHTRTSR